MEKCNRQQLTAQDWHVGTVDEFLGLNAEEAAYVELKLLLSDHLRFLLLLGASRADLARMIARREK